MFRCEKCKKVTEPREKQTKIVVLKRPRTYEFISRYKNRNHTSISYGTEIIKEISVCERCAAKNEIKIKSNAM